MPFPFAAARGPLIRFLLQFHQPLLYILLTAAAITAFLDEWVDASVIFGVVLVNAIIGYLQESKAATALEALAKTTLTEARVIRSGETRNVPSSELVPGDIVLLQSGDKVPADLRLLRSRDLQIDESALTGESVPVEKAAKELTLESPLAERRNMSYASTLVTYGNCSRFPEQDMNRPARSKRRETMRLRSRQTPRQISVYLPDYCATTLSWCWISLAGNCMAIRPREP